MADIDNISIQIGADASKATTALDGLIRKLDSLSTSLSTLNTAGLNNLSAGINNLSTSMANFKAADIKKSDFTRIANGLKTLDTVNAGQLTSLSSSLMVFSNTMTNIGSIGTNAQQLALAANAIGRLGYGSVNTAIANLNAMIPALNQFVSSIRGFSAITVDIVPVTNLASAMSQLGGANAQRAITTIPQLSKVVNDFIVTLSKAPNVNNNVLKLIESLAKLASNGNKAAVSQRNLSEAMRKSHTSAKSFNGILTSIASKIGRIYASLFLLKRMITTMWKSVKSAMSYLEVLNYYNAAMEQVAAQADLSSWKELGYESAEAYFNAMQEGLQTSFSKMSGFTVGEDGKLLSTNEKSLGLNPTTLMNYSAQYAQMATSMGVSSEYALKLSQALVEIGADLSSVKNLKFEDTWNNMASAMVGMSRTVDKFGINIRNANMNTKLLELGIDTTVAKLDQSDKALLRTIMILDSSRYAWGDLSDTINRPANQLRVLQAAWSNLSREIGNIFLPIVSKVLPYLTALANGLSSVARWIVTLLGFEDFDWGSFGGSVPEIMSDIADEAEETANGLGKAHSNAKKLKQQLLGIDELNNLTSKDDSGSGVGGGLGATSALEAAFDKIFDEYQAKWDEAFNNILSESQSEVDEFVSTLGQTLEPLATSLGNLFTPLAKFTGDNFKSFYQDFLKPVGSWALSEKGIPRLVNALASFAKINLPVISFGIKLLWQALSKIVMGIGQGMINFFTGLTNILTPVFFVAFETVNALIVAFWTAIQLIPTFVLEALGGAIAGIVTAFLAMKAISTIPMIINGIAGAFSKLMGVIYTSTAGVGWIAALTGAVVALGAAFLSWLPSVEKELEEEQIAKYGQTLKEIADEQEEATQRIIDASKERRDSVAQIEAIETPAIEKIADDYFALAESTEKTAEQYAEMKLKAGLLIDFLPELQNYYDESTGMIDMQRDAIQKLIEEKSKEIKLNALSEAYSESLKEQYETAKDLAEKEAQVQDAYNEWMQYMADNNIDADDPFSSSLDFLDNRSQLLKETYETTLSTYDDAKTAYETASSDVLYFEKEYIAEVTGVTDAMEEATKEANKEMDKVSEEYLEMLNKPYFATQEALIPDKETWNKYAEQFNKDYIDSFTTGMVDLENLIKTNVQNLGSDFSLDELMQAFWLGDSEGDIFSAYFDAYMERFTMDLSEAQTEAEAAMAAIANDEKGLQLKEKYAKELAQDATEQYLESFSQEVPQLVNNLLGDMEFEEGFFDGMFNKMFELDGSSEVRDVMLTFADSLKDTFAEEMQKENPADIWIGNFIGGIEENKEQVQESGIGMASSFFDGFEEMAGMNPSSERMEENGELISQGFADGLENSKSTVDNAISTWGGNVLGSLRTWATGIGSTIKTGVTSPFSDAIKSVKDMWNAFANDFNGKMEIDVQSLEIDGKNVFNGGKIKFAEIPKYKLGGFPEDGIFMANHNELVGEFSNGKTAVANNSQIVDGISAGVYNAVNGALAPYLAQIADNTREVAEKDIEVSTDGIFKSVRTSARTYQKSTGSPAFNF